MAFPTGMVTYPVVGKVAGLPDGAEVEVRFYSLGWLNSPVHDALVPPFYVDAAMEADGSFLAALPPTDHPDWPEFEYEVVARYGNKTLRGSVTVPYSDPDGVNISDRIQYDLPPAPSVLYMALSLRGAPGGVASLDGTGKVPLGQIPLGVTVAWASITGKPATFPPSAHTHAISEVLDLQVQLDGKQAAGTYLVPADITNLVSYSTLLEELGAYLTKVAPEVTDSTLTVRRTAGGAARWRTTGGALDIDVVGDVIESRFPNQDFTGAQVGLRRMRGDGNTLAGLTEFGNDVYGAQQNIDSRDPANLTAKLGGKSGAALLLGGAKLTPGPPTAGTWAVGEQLVDSDGVWWRCTGAGTPGTWSSGVVSTSGLIERMNLLTTGEEVLPRDDVAGELALVSGTVFWSFFTARKTETITQVRTATGATAASGLTLARIAVYSTNGTTLTLVASTASDTALWAATNTMYPKTFSASWGKVAGARYALAYLAVGTTMPTLECVSVRPNSVALPPRIQGELAGQANLPATGQTEAGMTNGFRRFQGILLP